MDQSGFQFEYPALESYQDEELLSIITSRKQLQNVEEEIEESAALPRKKTRSGAKSFPSTSVYNAFKHKMKLHKASVMLSPIFDRDNVTPAAVFGHFFTYSMLRAIVILADTVKRFILYMSVMILKMHQAPK
ncbi:hypothetical protein MUCCIDRAFT_161025 [Mucor lusitanicus CBS 277.49]|uniref:Uncharacterized protein n=1 Tax=Mucor lusitanicus CBS 277.49 TaxID=747725 RepID=A0A162MQG2_MUCCL|nr:hypothetical protein MUCCIDRAFT_161025 [Mucor lusitanicus CBS 277.49]